MNEKPLLPPCAEKIDKEIRYHDETFQDPYFWLREKENPKVIEHLKAENSYTESFMKDSGEFQEELYQEMKGRIKEVDFSVPVLRDGYYYYSRSEEKKEYRVCCRKKGSLDNPEEILLDLNKLAEGKEYLSLGVYSISPNHRFLAYSLDDDGSESFTLYIKDLEKKELLPEKFINTSYSATWASDNQTLFYTVLDDMKRPYRLFSHELGGDPKEAHLVYEEKDESFFLGVSKCKSREYLFLQLSSQVTSEVHFLKSDNPKGNFQLVQAREHGVEYGLAHHQDYFYILTNYEALNFQLMKTPLTQVSRENWEVVVAHRPEVKVEGIETFEKYLVLYEREKGLLQIHITDLDKQESHYVNFPEPVYTIYSHSFPNYQGSLLRFSYTSLVTPHSVFDYDMTTRQRELKKEQEIIGGYEKSLYHCERIFAPSHDGVEVPISLVYKGELDKNGLRPLYLYAYGSYGYSIDPSFSLSRLSLLDRGFVFAIAHIRGGSSLGRSWYEQGKMVHKKNTFRDFISCAEHLVQERYTNSDRIAISGGSAGGLLMGAVLNMRGDLFQVAVADVPFVDVINTMMDSSLPLTVIEYDEWGNPNEKEYFDYMKSYSPYDNVQAKNYPNILVTAGLNDPRVQYWEPAKWVAKLREMKTDDNVLLLKTNMGAGHGGASGRYERLKELAFEYSFIFKILGISNKMIGCEERNLAS